MDIEVSTPIVAEAEVKKYTLVGDDIYVKRYTNENIPDWYRQLISDIIAGNSQINSLNDAIAYINSWQDGYNVTLSSMQNGMLEVDTKLETLKTSNDQLTAGVSELWITKVDANSAQAISRDTVGAYFADGSAGAFFNEQISTYASAIEANAMDISTLSATLDNHTVSIDTIDSVIVTKAQVIRSIDTPTLATHPALKAGDLWINATTNIVKSWNGSQWVDTTNTEAVNATTELGEQLAKITDLEATRDGVIDTCYQTTAPSTGMSYGDYWLDTDSSVSGPFTVYRYENNVGGSIGTLGWYPNTGETARAINAAYVANKNAGTAQVTADGKVKTWYQVDEPTGLTAGDVGDIWVNTDTKVTKVWLASTAEGSDYAWRDITNTVGNQAYTWSATSVKNIKGADGSNMGFQLVSAGTTGEPSTAERSFTIVSDTFRIVAPSDVSWDTVNNVYNIAPGYTAPFSINTVTKEVAFNGKVTLTGLGIDSTTTTIDGGKITTGSVTTNQLNVTDVKAGSIFVDNTLTSSDFTVLGGAGFRLKSNAAGTYADPTMYGAYIRGGTIDSSTMNVRLLNLVNDFDYSVYPLFASYAPCTYVPIGGTNQFYLSIPFNFYTANSTFVTRNKLASLDDNVLLLTAAASSYGIHGGTITDSASMTSKVGTIALINCEVSETVRVSIYINGTEYSYIDVGGGAGDVNLNGFRFYRGGAGEGYGLFMYADHTSVSLNSTDEFPIELRITRLSNQPEDWVTYRTNPISLLVANIS